MKRTINYINCNNKKDKLTGLQILPSSLQDSIKNIINTEGYTTYDIEARKINTEGGSFLGVLYEVDIEGETAEGPKKTNLFIKQLITLTKTKLVSAKEVFLKEAFAYNDLSKIFAFLQDQAEVPQAERYKLAKAYDGTGADTIILENLAIKNFKTYDRRSVMPVKYVRLAVQEMAKLHGLSFVIEYKMPEYFNKNIKTMGHSVRYNEDWNELIRNIFTYIENLYNVDTKTKIGKFLPIFLEKYPKYNINKTDVKCSLTHDDYRIANVLVREHNGEPLEVVPIDYQLLDYGGPIRDFLFFIFSGTDREFRRNHMNDVKELYFESLSKFLKYFDMDVETVYPRKDFEKVYTEWLDFGLMKILFCSIFLFAPETGLDLSILSLSDIQLCPDKDAEERLKGIIEDFVQWGYL